MILRSLELGTKATAGLTVVAATQAPRGEGVVNSAQGRVGPARTHQLLQRIPNGHKVLVYVEDNGVGVAQLEDQDK